MRNIELGKELFKEKEPFSNILWQLATTEDNIINEHRVISLHWCSLFSFLTGLFPWTSAMAQQVKPPPLVPIFHMGAGISPSCSTFFL